MSAFDDYLTNRYQDQINWYDKKAAEYKKKYQKMQRWIIILSAITPILAAFDFNADTVDDKDNVIKVFVVVISAAVAILTSLLKVFRHYELWVNYRTAVETLKKEIYFFNNNASIYKGVAQADKEAMFVERVEGMFTDENKTWKESAGNQTNT